MASLIELFRPIIAEVNNELKKALGGIFSGPIVKSYLPQVWVFVTEEETISFIVDKDGNASAKVGPEVAPDVVISVDQAYISEALRTRARPKCGPKLLEIKFRTGKGETAFKFLRKKLGI